MPQVNENTVEMELLGWLEDLGYEVVFGPELAPDEGRSERKSYKHVLLEARLRDVLHRLKPRPSQSRSSASLTTQNANWN
jgi:type I restriction enzyme R subunit